MLRRRKERRGRQTLRLEIEAKLNEITILNSQLIASKTDLERAETKAQVEEDKHGWKLPSLIDCKQSVERLQSQATQLERYKSDFFGRIRELVEGKEGIKIVAIDLFSHLRFI